MNADEYTNLYQINESIGACLVGYPGILLFGFILLS